MSRRSRRVRGGREDVASRPVRGLVGKVVLVTGASSGIGEACVERLLAEGASVVGVDVAAPQHALDVAPDAVASFATVDVRDEAQVVDVIGETVETYGRIDGVITAAGVAGGGAVHALEREEWQRVLDVNLTGTFLVCKHAIARMLEQS